MGNNDSFGRWPKQQRKALAMTQHEMASQAGCAEVTLRKVEAGDLRPSAQLAASLIRSAGVADADLPDLLDFALSAGSQRRARRVRSHRPHNSPAQLTRLLGRAQDIAAARRRLLGAGARPITLVGPPCVGKTRLALAVAEDVLGQFEHGVVLVRLGPLADADLVTPAIIQALGLRISGPTPPVVQVRAALEHRYLLLVPDNFEHVVEAAPLVDGLLRRCPWLHILATSRQPLRVRGERKMPVPPLALPILASPAARLTAADALRYPAVALFAERGQAVQPDFAVTDANAGVVAELCRRLDGLALAIELVAAHVKLLPPEELLAHLSGPWMLSVNGLRTVAAPALAAPFAIVEQPGWQQIDADMHNLRAGLAWALQRDGRAALSLVLATCRSHASHGFGGEARGHRSGAGPAAGRRHGRARRAALLPGRRRVPGRSDQRSRARLGAVAGAQPGSEPDCRAGRRALLPGQAGLPGRRCAARRSASGGCRRGLGGGRRDRRLEPCTGRTGAGGRRSRRRPAARRGVSGVVPAERQRDHPVETAWLLTYLGEIATRRGTSRPHTRPWTRRWG
jgi:DNA-binding XRE family transcriptional regulator